MIKSPTPCLREEGVTGGLATPGMKVSLRTPILSFMEKKTATSFPRLRQEDEIFLQDQDSVRTMRQTFPQASTLPAAAPASTSTSHQTNDRREAFKVLDDMFRGESESDSAKSWPR